MTEKLDRSKSFGIVYGHPEIRYQQGGKDFKHDGTLYGSETVESQSTPTPIQEPPKILVDPKKMTQSERMRQYWIKKRADDAAREQAEANTLLEGLE